MINKIVSSLKIFKKATGKNLPLLEILDCLFEKAFNHLIIQEYLAFDFFHKSKSQRKEYVYDWEVMHTIPDKYNDAEQIELLENKSKFNELFKDLLGRDFLYIDKNSRKSFEKFIQKHNSFIVKPLNKYGGNGIKKYYDVTPDVFDTLIEKYEICLIEEIFVQNDIMSSLNPDTVNTLRVLSFRDKEGNIQIPYANIRIGRKGAEVDNFCSGGMTAAIDVNSGMVISDAFDKDLNEYHYHPDTDTLINGFTVPYWTEIIQTVSSAMNRISKMRYVGWDVVISKDNQICIIEANHNPEARIHQISLGRGLKAEYKNLLGDF